MIAGRKELHVRPALPALLGIAACMNKLQDADTIATFYNMPGADDIPIQLTERFRVWPSFISAEHTLFMYLSAHKIGTQVISSCRSLGYNSRIQLPVFHAVKYKVLAFCSICSHMGWSCLGTFQRPQLQGASITST